MVNIGYLWNEMLDFGKLICKKLILKLFFKINFWQINFQQTCNDWFAKVSKLSMN